MNSKNNKLVVALSGGADSIVLLHYAHSTFSYSSLRAIHINHHYSPHADQWQSFCEEYCSSLDISYTALDIAIQSTTNIEAVAREKRYQALFAELDADEVLLTAHHQNDQAETVLLHACRGSSALGLSAMKECTPKLWRPLLHKSQEWILDYAKDHDLNYVYDESNADTGFRRNFMRHEVIPMLETRYPSVVSSLAKVAHHQQTTRTLLDELAQLDIASVEVIKEGHIHTTSLLTLSKERALNVLYYYLRMHGIPLPSFSIACELYNAFHSADDAKVLVQWAGHYARIHKGLFYIEVDESRATHQLKSSCPYFAKLSGYTGFHIKYRTPGQRVQYAHKTHSQSLAELMRMHNIPHWKRDTIRLYYINELLVAIEGVGYLCPLDDIL